MCLLLIELGFNCLFKANLNSNILVSYLDDGILGMPEKDFSLK